MKLKYQFVDLMKLLCFFGVCIFVRFFYVMIFELVDLVVVGVLFDIGGIYCVGVCFGFELICSVFVFLRLYNLVFEVDVFVKFFCIDYGDFDVIFGYFFEVYDQIIEQV